MSLWFSYMTGCAASNLHTLTKHCLCHTCAGYHFAAGVWADLVALVLTASSGCTSPTEPTMPVFPCTLVLQPLHCYRDEQLGLSYFMLVCTCIAALALLKHRSPACKLPPLVSTGINFSALGVPNPPFHGALGPVWQPLLVCE